MALHECDAACPPRCQTAELELRVHGERVAVMAAGERARVAALGRFTGEDEERVALRVQEARARVLEYEQGRARFGANGCAR